VIGFGAVPLSVSVLSVCACSEVFGGKTVDSVGSSGLTCSMRQSYWKDQTLWTWSREHDVCQEFERVICTLS
jgi:hypothetical protein